MDLTFGQSKDSQLHSATVMITLNSKDSFGLDSISLTDKYGPKGFTGPEKTANIKKLYNYSPNVQFAGVNIGGLGGTKEKTYATSSRWKFSGHLLPGKNERSGAYKTLKFELSENDLEAKSQHSSTVHTAFAFEHGEQPFSMRVEIKGKLKNISGRALGKLMRLSPRKKRDSAISSLFHFSDQVLFDTPLDDRAQQLEFEMEMENTHAIPMEISDPKPATFMNVPQNLELSNIPDFAPHLNEPSHPQGPKFVNSSQQQLPSPTQPHLLQKAGVPMAIEEDASDHMTVNLKLVEAFENLHTGNRHNDIALPSSTTDVDDITEMSSVEGDVMSGMEESEIVSDEQMLHQLLEVPVILTLLRMITGLMGAFGQRSSSSTMIRGVNKDEQVLLQLLKLPVITLLRMVVALLGHFNQKLSSGNIKMGANKDKYVRKGNKETDES